jgi:hypothetical protein
MVRIRLKQMVARFCRWDPELKMIGLRLSKSAVAPLVGATPRTVKRFVNTYRLLKARASDPAEFDHPQGAIGDHEVVAFLLAVVTGRSSPNRAENSRNSGSNIPPRYSMARRLPIIRLPVQGK